MKKWSLILIVILTTLVLAACNSAETQEPVAEPVAAVESNSAEGSAMADDTMAEDDAMMEDDAMADDEAMMEDDTHDDAMAEDETMIDDEAAMDDEMAESELSGLPGWQTLVLTNARTGEQFTLADFNGQTVFVEPMATWCTNCRSQLSNVREARATLGDDTVFVALSLETTLEDAQLAAYADQQGFDWLFAVMTDEMLQQLADQFGRSITSAPSTPHFVIRPDGSFTDLVTGIESPQEIVEQITNAMQG
ncbi:MAG: redoxin domain-containing protein [Anaerolineae bacterium]|nr:redoxin domain-containing protein [Anaerolineae bacterium]